MENLNAEQIKYCLELILKSGIGMSRDDVDVTDIKRALALINSQEQSIKELTEDNERLRAENAKYEAENHAEFNKWLKLEEATKRHHSELFEEAKVAVKEETVRKMHSMLCEGRVSNDNVVIVANQIAKEILEGQ